MSRFHHARLEYADLNIFFKKSFSMETVMRIAFYVARASVAVFLLPCCSVCDN